MFSVAIDGPAGAGKSTIFKLILGLYSPQQGSVTIFGTPADQISDQQKRRLFGYVEQTLRPVSGTVSDQISLFDETITADQITEAVRLVGLDSVIDQLPQGLATPWDPALFSQGQLQLLAIARAVAADPRILLLDEITANLDSGTEALVMEALRRASLNRTVISISHRLYQQNGNGRLISI